MSWQGALTSSQYSDPRRIATNEDFERLDEPIKGAAIVAVRGMAIDCAKASDNEGSGVHSLSV